MIKVRASGSEVYLCFMKKGRQARHRIPRNSCAAFIISGLWKLDSFRVSLKTAFCKEAALGRGWCCSFHYWTLTDFMKPSLLFRCLDVLLAFTRSHFSELIYLRCSRGWTKTPDYIITGPFTSLLYLRVILKVSFIK